MIKLDDVLSPVTALGFDTPTFIYFIERHPDYLDIVREISGAWIHGDDRIQFRDYIDGSFNPAKNEYGIQIENEYRKPASIQPQF